MSAEKKNKDIEEARRRLAERDNKDLLVILGMAEGRRLLWTLMGRAGIFRSSFSTNQLMMAAREGERNIGLELFNNILSVQPAAFTLMQREARTDSLKQMVKEAEDKPIDDET